MSDRRLLLVFVDGLGLAPPGPHNPIRSAVCPRLCALLAAARPLDACLGVAGLPQSATGQTALLTGINAPQVLGRHLEGFPNATLRGLIERNGIFKHCREAGLSSVFANGYMATSVDAVAAARLKSATTVAALSGLGHVLTRSELEANRAVAHDVIRDTLVPRGYTGPLIGPRDAAGHLAALAGAHRFTLFEFFLTDRAGHRRAPERAEAVLGRLDAFIAAMSERLLADGLTLALTSDHGNIEDLSVATHTRNPVPWAVSGPDAALLTEIPEDLTGIVPAIMRFLSP